ncbi:hypothetical protein D3C76_1651030 [compost metagenome]
MQADRQAIGVGAADTTVGFDEARVVGDALAVELEVGVAFDAPDHFAHRRAGLDGRRQASLVDVGEHHAATVEGFEDHLVSLLADFAQAPVAEKTRAGFQVFDTVGDFINA